MKKKNSLLAVVIILDLTITVLSLMLGCLMYASNSKAIIRNKVYVELTDFISNIEYGLHFGKSLESYYGMEDELKSLLDTTDGIDSVYIVTEEGDMLFKTDERVLDREVLILAGGSSLKRGNKLYCSFDFASDARLITLSDLSENIKEWNAYYRYLCFVAFSGFFVSAGLMFLLYNRGKDEKKGYYSMLVILALWIIIISSYVGYCAYTEYMKSISGLDEAIGRAIEADMSSIRAAGIKDENITGIGEYLKRYSDNINEIHKITYDGKDYRFEISSSYLKRKLIDYLLQTLLFLAFSSMLLAEYQIFMSGIRKKESGDDEDA